MPNSANSSVVKLRRKEAPAQQQRPGAAQAGKVPRIGYHLKDGIGQLQLHHDGDEASAVALLTRGLAMPDRDMLLGYLGMVAGYAINDGKIDEDRVNFIVQFVATMKPKDPAETMMLTQMAAVQYLTMMFASRLGDPWRGPGGAGRRRGNRMSPTDRLNLAPRCHATSKRTGNRCRGPAVKGWKVCRFHGARGGAPRGPANGAYSTGLHTREAVAARKHVAALLKRAAKLADAVDRGEMVNVGLILMEDAL